MKAHRTVPQFNNVEGKNRSTSNNDDNSQHADDDTTNQEGGYQGSGTHVPEYKAVGCNGSNIMTRNR